MKKIYLSLIAIFSVLQFTYGQWTTSGSNIYNTNTGNVGIGTTSPADIFDVQKNQNAITNFYFRNTDNTNTNSRAYLNLISGANTLSLRSLNGNNNYLSFGAGNFGIQYQSNNPALTVLSTGNVGIGTASPKGLLGLADQTSIVNTSGITLGANSSSIEFLASPFGLGYGSQIYAIDPSNGAVDLRFAVRQGTTSWSDAMTIRSNTGNVGIGTTTPASLFHIALDANTSGAPGNAQLFITGATSPGKRLSLAYNTSSNYGEIQAQAFNGSYSPLNLNPNGGNVGIGTSSPTAQLTVQKDLAATQTLYVNRLPNASLELVSTTSGAQVTIQSQPTSLSVLSFNHGATNYGNIYTNSNNSSLNINGVQGGPVTFSANNSEAMRILSSGNIAVGTTDSHGYKLAVNGSAIATSMTVQLYANWPDYVFKKDHRLPSLADVKTYINAYHRLPGMPSEQQVAKDGLNLGEINQQLVKKVEELTLYLIAGDEKEKKQENINAQLKDKLKAQQAEINDLNQKVNKLLNRLANN